MKAIDTFSIKLERQTACDFCGSQDFTKLFDKMRHNINLETKVCNHCLLVQTNPLPTQESINDFYENYYHSFHEREGVDQKYIAKSKRMAKKRISVLSEFLKSEQTEINLLEVGPGAGEFILGIQALPNVQAEAIELGKESYQYCSSLGINVSHVGIEDFKANKTYDVVASFHVLEHVPSPVSFVRKCHDIISPDGLLYLEVPNFDKPGGKYSSFLQFPHLYNFTANTLMNILKCNGFEPIYLNDDISRLSLISRKVNHKSENFIRQDSYLYIKKVHRKNQCYELNDKIPNILFLRKIKELLRTY
jgi:2-polyprenyl-3-methyl-5-hydroxy-6-metoxy-1,4-benzoquinol methylase